MKCKDTPPLKHFVVFFFVMVESRNKGRATVKQRSHLQTLYMEFNKVNNKITVKIKLILLTKMPLEEQKRWIFLEAKNSVQCRFLNVSIILNKLCSLHVSNQISFSSVVREIAAHCTENKFKQRFEMKLFHNTVNRDFEEWSSKR